ncbi:rac GTPase-activating protein 1-like [Daphnia pulicaria]|uniref:rac GTPase-activating protein 1-like n=1 Tax=Daphnia pulicaria TaxID=35523 RepID=UPI001EEC2AA9|nr:rac GTPase-activating protein 1-like [Daphnia pulicaria]XP_046639478.1 rac GTPase-activating protein 1-like [Daphnia pulicaria]
MASKKISLLAQFDDICRGFSFWINDPLREFEVFANNQEDCRKKWLSTEEMCSTALKELNEARANREKLELQVRHVTELLKNEILIRQRLQKEEKDLERKLIMVKQIVTTDQNITEETRDRLVSISSIESYSRCDLESPGNHLIDSTSDEIESSTQSILSSLDITSEKTDEDLELSVIRSVRKFRGRALNETVNARDGNNKRPHPASRSIAISNTIAPPELFSIPPQTTRKISMDFPGEFASPTSNQFNMCNQGNDKRSVSATKKVLRPHMFSSKVILKQETCIPCRNRIRFGKTALKCSDCLGTCHVECKSSMPIPCVPTCRTPTRFVGSIADYSPKTTPMIPSLIIHCVEEIEVRGLECLDYRAIAPEKEIIALKEQLLRGKIRSGEMSSINTPVITNVVRSFLQSLKEPLVTYTARESFIKLAYVQEEIDVQTAVCSLIPELPRPNRDTLAYLILHFQRVVENQRSRLSTINIAKCFAPMIIGHSRSQIDDGLKKLQDMKEQQMVMEKLLNIASDYWNCHASCTDSPNNTPVKGKRNLKKTGFFTSPHF